MKANYVKKEAILHNCYYYQVNRKSAWDELLESFEIPDSTVNGAILLKQTYLRYLDTYEKIHYLGEDGDDADDDDWYKDAEDSRSRRQKSQKVQNSVPLSYNLNQHNVSGNKSNCEYCRIHFLKFLINKFTIPIIIMYKLSLP